MSHAVISYSREDSGYAHLLARTLEDMGFAVWIDDKIDYGTKWADVIEQNIDDCGAFILIMSPHAHESSWVRRELALAQTKNKPLFPLLLAGKIWPAVEDIQLADIQDGQLPPAKFYSALAKYVTQITTHHVKSVHLRKYMFRQSTYIDPTYKPLIDAIRARRQTSAPLCVGVCIRSYPDLEAITRRLLMVTPNIAFWETADQDEDLKLYVVDTNLISYGYEGFGSYEAVYGGMAYFTADNGALRDWLRATGGLAAQGIVTFQPLAGEFNFSDWDADPVDGGQLPYESIQEHVDWTECPPRDTWHRAIHPNDALILDYPEFKPLMELALPVVEGVSLDTLGGWSSVRDAAQFLAMRIDALRACFARDDFAGQRVAIQEEITARIAQLRGDLDAVWPTAGLRSNWKLAIYGIVKTGNTVQFRGYSGDLLAATPAYARYLIEKLPLKQDETYFLWAIR
ncbi:toll/interleukin-1 receptor domain-containing protein [Aggregatilinea lenta]|uniref:toll/interleukin-1 receptor domain-containing protein n=1 Tax=Aggregatilinea lenta TaxID=913108 RepID=UPI000E5C3932|nr:toll/interleukin-1 receptor domain-containing protein [Aggregatilinea lenta]